ncbi:hypothetical protein [Synechococcus sp. BDU 130192]|uniref:hypothetical protein n=2 Tax=Synechococcus sp. BDU 130192 TaxID=2042059 RepID=UPI000C081BC8|nr:hypothetical protein [Synechococcus sp. BDU 130192]
MARTAGIVIRVEPETRDRLNQIAQENGVELATELYKVAARIADGELDLLALAGGAAPAPVDINSKINEAIAPALEGIEGELSLLKKRLALIEENHGGKIINVEAIANEPANNEAMTENSPSRMAPIERSEPVTTNHPKTTDKSVAAVDIAKGLNGTQLAEFLGVAGSTFRGWLTKVRDGKWSMAAMQEKIREKDPTGIWRLDAEARWADNLKDSQHGLWFREEK